MKVLTFCILLIVSQASAQNAIRTSLLAGHNNKAIRKCHKLGRINNSAELKYYESIALCMKDYRYPFYYSKKTIKAKSILLDLVKQFPNDGRYHFRLGLCYYRMREFPSAFNEFTLAAELIKGEEWITAYRSMAAEHLNELSIDVINKLLLDMHDDLSASENPTIVAFFQKQGALLANEYNLNDQWNFGVYPLPGYSEIQRGIFDFEWDTLAKNNVSTRDKYGKYLCFESQSESVDTVNYSEFGEWLKTARWISMSQENEITNFQLTVAKDYQLLCLPESAQMTDAFTQVLLNLHNGNKFFIDNIEVCSKEENISIEPLKSLTVVFRLDNPNAIWHRHP